MRLGSGQLGLAALALGLMAGCSRAAAADPAAAFGCGEVDGLGSISGKRPPAYVLIGEAYETKEALGAFAELACQLAARQPADRPLWVGLPDYIGGSTEAEGAMRKRLAELVAKGAPLVIGSSGKGHTVGGSRREEAERRWADTIMASVAAEHAGRALLLLSHEDGRAVEVIPDDSRREAYPPMALFLPEGQMVNLEIGRATGVGAPTVRIYLNMERGYAGQLVLAKLTPAQKVGGPKLKS